MNEIELLKQIAENTSEDNTVIIAFITGFSTLFAAFIGSFFSYLHSKKQIDSSSELEVKKLKASLVSSERLRWLKDLRSRFSSFYVNLGMHISYLRRGIPQDDGFNEYQRKVDERSEIIMRECTEIILLLNPKKPTQKGLIDTLNTTLRCAQIMEKEVLGGNLKFDTTEYHNYKERAHSLIADIGIETWSKIKNMD